MNMIIGKRQIILASLVLALGIAVYLNWFLSSGTNELPVSNLSDGKTYGEIQYTNAEEDSGAAYFANARIERDASRQEAIDTLEAMIAASNLSEEDTDTLLASVAAITENIQAESKIENILKAKGFADCMVYVDEANATIIVKTPGLLSTEQAQITDVMLTETGLTAENIKIVEAN